MAAARAASMTAVPLSVLADQLDGGALGMLSAGDEVSSVRNVLSWSYLRLPEPAARVFRFLGLHPGPEITAAAAAALADVPLSEAVPLVGELAAMNLVAERAPGRFSMHGLLRAFAAELLADETDGPVRAAAEHRLYDYYLRWAIAADRSYTALPIDVESDHVPLPPGLEPPGFTDRDAGLAWMAAEQQVLTTLVSHAAGHGADAYAWRLAASQSCGLTIRGRYDEELRLSRMALAAAKRLDDPMAQACSYFQIGRSLTAMGEILTARFQLHRALRLFRAVDAAGRIGEVHRTLATCA
ncbi:hypothetical protein GCM10010430_06650 [Kitasatospora cystarginea]|uniref:Uncharacterized protein n=1 Tax=Kitasatospora cystarginea TaxID=58350 RepID=A0ABN3DF48_9ACTN